MKIEDVIGGKLGGTGYTMVEAKYNGVVVWPLGTASYQILSGTINVTYSDGYYTLRANGQNCVQRVTASVQNTVTGEITTGVRLTLSLRPGTSYIMGGGNTIWGRDLSNNETSQHSEQIDVAYSNATTTITIYQEANVKTRTGINSKVYDYSSSVTTASDTGYYLDSFTASPYNGTSYPCPASGGISTLSYHAGHTHLVVVTTPWTRTANYSFTSGATSTEPYDSGSEITSQTSTPVTDTPTITGSATGFSRNGNEVTIANRGTNNNDQESSAARSVTYTATNGSGANAVTASVTIYQEANVPVSSYRFILSVDIDVDGKIPAEPGIYDVNYVSQRATTKVYPSGAYVDLGTSDITTSVSVSGTGSATPDVNSVTGTGKFTLSVAQNSDTDNEKTITVSISTAGATPASDTVTQEAATIIVTPTARIYPDVDTDGRVRVRLSMTQGQFPAGNVVISGMVYHYVLENQGSGTEQTRTVSGDITITQDGDAVRLGNSFTWLPGTSGEHWFSATSVSRIGLNNITFTHENFDIMGL